MSHTRALRLVIGCALLVPFTQVYAASFTVSAADTTAKSLNPAGGATQTGVVDAAGDLNISGGTVAVVVTQAAGGSGTATATITNNGKIRQIGTGRAIRNSSGAVAIGITNNTGATISSVGDDAIQVSVPGSTFTLDNSGTISTKTGRAVNLRDAGANTINNLAGGILRSEAGDAVRPGTNGIINNYGTIEAILRTATAGAVTQAESDDGIQADIVSTTGLPVNNVVVTNFNGASISGRHGITGGASTTADFSITVNNNAGATLTGNNGAGINIDNEGDFMGNAIVNNSGTILGKFDSTKYNTGDGDGVDIDGILTLVNSGIIRGTGAGGLGSDGGANNPEGVSIGGGTITNNAGAEITGQDTTGTGTKGHGILSDDSSGGNAFAATTITNAGLIRGFDSYAIRFIDTLADTITNNATGVIRGGGSAGEGAAIQTGDGADILNNSGTITGDNGLAVDLEAGDDVMHVIGAVATISGNVSGGSGSNTLDIDPTASGSFSYSGVLSNFSSVEIKSGTVTLTGASTYTGATKVSAGTLIANNASGNATGTGLVTVKSGASLRGTGKVGAVIAESGSAIAPGTSVARGTLTVDGALTLAGGSNLQFTLGATSDRLNVTGAVTGSGTVTVNIADAGIVAGTEYTLVSFGSSSGLSSSNVVLGSKPAGFKGKLKVKSGSLVLAVSGDSGGGALSLWSVLVLGVLGLFAVQRKRQMM